MGPGDRRLEPGIGAPSRWAEDLSSIAQALGGGTDLRLAEPATAAEQRLRGIHRNLAVHLHDRAHVTQTHPPFAFLDTRLEPGVIAGLPFYRVRSHYVVSGRSPPTSILRPIRPGLQDFLPGILFRGGRLMTPRTRIVTRLPSCRAPVGTDIARQCNHLTPEPIGLRNPRFRLLDKIAPINHGACPL